MFFSLSSAMVIVHLLRGRDVGAGMREGNLLQAGSQQSSRLMPVLKLYPSSSGVSKRRERIAVVRL
jgi:hypothetical protein